MDEASILALTGSPWVYLVLFVLVVGDAFLVVLPSETVVVALAALWSSTGEPSLALVLLVAAVGAGIGDFLCFLIGRHVGLDRWAWQRRGRVARVLARARRTILRRTAVLIFTARYIPFARIAVNLAAGASGLSLSRYLPLSIAAGTAWALYNGAIGALVGSVLSADPLLAVPVSIGVAIALGMLVDRVLAGRRLDAD